MKYALIVTRAGEIEIEIGPDFTDGDVDALAAAAQAVRAALPADA